VTGIGVSKLPRMGAAEISFSATDPERAAMISASELIKNRLPKGSRTEVLPLISMMFWQIGHKAVLCIGLRNLPIKAPQKDAMINAVAALTPLILLCPPYSSCVSGTARETDVNKHAFQQYRTSKNVLSFFFLQDGFN
jgi:hypothetical protein